MVKEWSGYGRALVGYPLSEERVWTESWGNASTTPGLVLPNDRCRHVAPKIRDLVSGAQALEGAD